MTQLSSKSTQDIDPNEWIDAHSDVLYKYALPRVQQRDIAEDMVQETFLAALKNIDSFSGKSTIQTWLISILRHKIADYYRKSNRETDENIDDILEDFQSHFFNKKKWKVKLSDWRANPEELFSQKEFMLVVKACLKKLPRAIASAFILKEMSDVDSKEICKDLDISESNLWVRLHRSRMSLRQCLEENWFSD